MLLLFAEIGRLRRHRWTMGRVGSDVRSRKMRRLMTSHRSSHVSDLLSQQKEHNKTQEERRGSVKLDRVSFIQCSLKHSRFVGTFYE